MLRCLIALILGSLSFAQQESWKRPFPPHKIAGNLYYVGTEDLACFLITTPEGHILINTGLVDSTPLLRQSFQKLGFKLEDIKILLTMQAHFDHVAAMAEVQKLTGAKMLATVGDAAALEDGGKSDPYFNNNLFAPVKVDRKLKDGDKVRLGGVELIVRSTPGHSKGSAGYSMNVIDGGKNYQVQIVNMGSVVMPLVGNTKYPQIAEDYARSFQAQKALKADIWVAAHGSQYGLPEKYKAGSFVDPEGYQKAVERHEKMFQEQLAREREKTK